MKYEYTFFKAGTMRTVKINSDQYPFLLKEIYDPPPILYYYGNINLDWHRAFSIVGTRTCSSYGRRVTNSVAKKCAAAGLIIVSGLARGIDSCAHSASGPKVAVLGHGLNYLYPPENVGLASRIIKEGGLLLSEFPPDHPPARYTFVKRNRIISGLSRALLVIEASAKSGALITADFALSQNREIYALPGNIDQKTSIGCNRLITSCTAYPFTKLDDLKLLYPSCGESPPSK